MVTCPKCDEQKREESFCLDKHASSGRFLYCKTCELERVKRYYQDNKERCVAARFKYRAEHLPEEAIRHREWNLKNPEKKREGARRSYLKDKALFKARAAAWNRAHPVEKNARYLARVAAKRACTPAWANKFFIMEAYRLRKLRMSICGGVWHVDHIVPIKSKIVCGLHWEGNLQVIPGVENFSKSNIRWPNMP